MRIGVIGVQGAVTEHIEALHITLAKIGVHGDVMWVRRLDQLREVSALVIPGGESTTISKLMCWNGLFDEVKRLGEGTTKYARSPQIIKRYSEYMLNPPAHNHASQPLYAGNPPA